jgi:glycosyltransferase involved in cell wall biosynthesis
MPGPRSRTSARKARILNVVGRLDRGGVETWLMHVLRHIDRTRFAVDFLVHTDVTAAFDDEVRSLGSRIIPLPSPTPGLRYASRFRRAIQGGEGYDLVHSHVHHFSGVVLRAAYLAGVRARIAHSHSDTSATQAMASTWRRGYLTMTEALIRRYATMGLAASAKAGEALFTWRPTAAECPWRVLHYGIDLEPFKLAADRLATRKDLGIPEGTLVVGHVGNLVPVKNHPLLIRAFAEMSRHDAKTILLLIGTGPLRADLDAQIAALGLTQRVIFAGARSDVPRLLMGAVDVFMFPSLWEGLPLAVVEAQAAGLPIVLSDKVSEEADIVPEQICRLSPEMDATAWADACLRLATARTRGEGYRRVAESDLNIDRSVAALQDVYESSTA